MKTNATKFFGFALLILTLISCDKKEELITQKISEINSELESLIDTTYQLKYKDTVISMILVDKKVGWNGSDSGQGTYAFDEKLGMVILKADVINEGRERHSFEITETLPANFKYFQEREENQLSNKFKKIDTELKAKFEWKGVKYLDALGKFNFLNQKFKQNYSLFREKIETSNATVRYKWSVRGNNNSISRKTGKLTGGLKVTLRKFEEPKDFARISEIEQKLNELNDYISSME